MEHLVKENLTKLENNLLWVKSVRDSIFAWWFNAAALIVVVGSFAYFIYASYGSSPPEELQKIPFQPQTWHNAVRNVPTTEYGQLPKTEAGVGVQGFVDRNRGTAF